MEKTRQIKQFFHHRTDCRRERMRRLIGLGGNHHDGQGRMSREKLLRQVPAILVLEVYIQQSAVNRGFPNVPPRLRFVINH